MMLCTCYVASTYASAHPDMHIQPKHTLDCPECFMFPLTSWSFSPTFIVEVLLSLACLPFDGRPAVYHMDSPLHFHILLALLERLDEKLPIISPDETCLEKWLQISAAPPLSKEGNSTGASNYSVPDQLEDLRKCKTWGMTQLGVLRGL